MSRIHTLGLAWFLVLLASTAVWADLIPPGGGPRRPRVLPPKPAPEPARENETQGVTAPVIIKHKAIRAAEKPVVAKILLPRSLAKSLAATPEAKQSGALTPDFRTLIAGLSLSAAAVCGLVVMRGRRAARWVAAGCVLTAVVFGAWSFATADIPAPPPPPTGKVVVEFVDGTDTVTILTAE